MSLYRVLALLGIIFAPPAVLRSDIAESPLKPRSHRLSHEGAVCCVAVSPDGKVLATCAADKRVHLWDAEGGKELGPFPALKEAVLCVAFSPDGKTLASGCADKTIRFWQLDPIKQIQQVEIKQGPVDAIAYSPDGKLVASGGADRMVRLWDAGAAKEVNALAGHSGAVTSVAFSPNGKVLVSGGKDRTVRLWDVRSGKEITRNREHRGWVHAVAFSPDGQSVASAGQDQTIVLWDIIAERRLLKMESYEGSFLSVAFSPDGRILVAGSKDRKVHLWDLASGKALPSATGHKGMVLSLAFSKDLLVCGSDDGTAMIWDAADLPRRQTAKEALGAKDLERLWTELGGDQEATTYRALQVLAAHGGQSVKFLDGRLKGVDAPDQARLTKLVKALDDDEFTVREKATEELLGGGELVEKALRKMLQEKMLSLEAKRRLEQIVDTIANRHPTLDEKRRRQMALEALERIGTAEATQVLKRLAEGPSDAALTQEAKTALDRLEKRAAAKP